MRKHIGAGFAVLVVGVLALSACTANTVNGTQAPEDPEASFAALYDQKIEWGECDEGYGLSGSEKANLAKAGAPIDTAECAMVEAPLDWNDPENKETIELAVVHVPATGSEKTGTLFGNPGGPGQSGLDYTYDMMVSPGFDAVMEHYDLFGFDPRGIGRSTPIECDPESQIPEVQIAVCADENPLAHSMGTSQVARDMDLLRALQGEDKLDYLGYSYGTMLGATYATLYPERVGRMALDSAEDATWASPTGSYIQQEAFAEQIKTMLEGCGTKYAATVCPPKDDVGLASALQDATESPLVATDGTEVDGAMLYGALQLAAYGGVERRTAALDVVGRALGGDQAAIDQVALDMAGGGAAIGMVGGIVRCHSLPDDPDIVGLIDYIAESGVEVSDEILERFADLSCDALPESGDEPDEFTGPVNTTILVVGITGDPATPYEMAKALSEQLPNARLLTLEGDGHAVSYTNRSACVDDAVTAFLLNGDLPEKGAVCQDD